MATMQNPGIPRVKLESTSDGSVKPEPVDVEMTSPYSDEEDGLDDGGDLDFTNAQQLLWLTQIPRSLWQTWSTLGLDEEIEIGTIRIEGTPDDPHRISLKLNDLDAVHDEYKEYNLRPQPNSRRRSDRPGQALVFSEQDLPGYKAKPFSWEQVDEDGNPGQGRSQLYEKYKRDQQRKENDGKWEARKRKAIPKKTALAGTVVRELEADPVKNQEYWKIEARRERANLAQPEKEATIIYSEAAEAIGEKTTRGSYMATAEQKRAATKTQQDRKNKAQQNRGGPELSFDELANLLRDLFGQYSIWKYPDLRAKTRQPDKLLNDVLSSIAFKHTSGDFAPGWELKDDQKLMHGMSTMGAVMAPGVAEDSDTGLDGGDDDDNDGAFIDAMPI